MTYIVTAHLVMARVHVEQRAFPEACAAIAKALQLRPSDADAIVLHVRACVCGCVCLRRGRPTHCHSGRPRAGQR